MDILKNSVGEELERPVEELAGSEAEAVEGGLLPAVRPARKAGGTQQNYYKVTMKESLITQY